MAEPRLYTFEGLDGAGKTTNVSRLRDELAGIGLSAAALASPSKSILGKFIRANMMELEPELKDELFIVDMIDSLRKVQDEADVILFDRYTDSIYSSNAETTMASLASKAHLLPRPHMTFLLNLTPEQSWEREGDVSDHPLNIEWLRQKHQRYAELTRAEPERFHIIDASRDIEEVFGQLLTVVMADMTAVERVES